MFDSLFTFLERVDSFFWTYVAFILIACLGSCLTIYTRFFQFRTLPVIISTFTQLMGRSSKEQRGVHPLKAFFASVGGMIGIGNVVGIVTAIQFGGPGALFWVWVAAMIGGIIKYSEIYLGLRFRVANKHGGYDGGPMYFLQQAFKWRWIPIFVAILLCIYGVEIYQFTVVAESVTSNFGLNKYLVILGLLAAVLYASLGGVARVGKICALFMPLFVLIYMVMALWIVAEEIQSLPGILRDVFITAFTGHAAVGGFAGSSIILAIQWGISRAAYSADIGIGYDSIIQSESTTVYPERQARLAILGVCVDNIVCTMSILIVLVTGIWKAEVPIDASHLIQTAMSAYFPGMNLFMPLFILIVGYTTLIAYFTVGLKCARFLYPRHGEKLYIFYGIVMLLLFSFLEQGHALTVMSIAGALLLSINLLGIFRLRHEIAFVSEDEVISEKSKQAVRSGSVAA